MKDKYTKLGMLYGGIFGGVIGIILGAAWGPGYMVGVCAFFNVLIGLIIGGILGIFIDIYVKKKTQSLSYHQQETYEPQPPPSSYYTRAQQDQQLQQQPSQQYSPVTPSPYQQQLSPAAPLPYQEQPYTVSAFSALNYEKANVVYKVKIENKLPHPIGRIQVKPFVQGDTFKIDSELKAIDMLDAGQSETVTFKLRPTKECGNVEIFSTVTYFDTAKRQPGEIKIEPKTTSIICPMMKRVEINENRWRELTSSMLKVEEATEDIPLEAENLFIIVNDVILDLNIYRLEPVILRGQNILRAIARFYSEGVKGLRYCAYVEVVGSEMKSKLIIRAYAENEQSLIGFYHCILDEIEKRTKIKEYIPNVYVRHTEYHDSVVYKSDGL